MLVWKLNQWAVLISQISSLSQNVMVTITWRTDLIFLLWFTVIRSWHWWGRWRRTLKPKQEKKLSLVERKYFQLVIIIIKCHVKCKIIMFPFNYEKCKHSSLFCVSQTLGVLWSLFGGYVPLASENTYPIIVYSVANYRPHLVPFCTTTTPPPPCAKIIRSPPWLLSLQFGWHKEGKKVKVLRV